MSAMVSFDRVFEVLDLEPMIAEAARRRAGPGRRPVRSSSTRVSFSYPSAAEVSLPSLEEVSLPEHGGPVDVLHDVSFRVEPGQLVALVGHSGAGKSTIADLVAAALRRHRGSGPGRRRRRPRRRPWTRCATRSAWSARTRTCSTTRIRANLLYARARGHRGELWSALTGRPHRRAGAVAARRAGHRRRRPRLPALRRGEAAAGDRPGAAQGARHRDPRRGDRAPGQRVGGRRAARAGRGAGRADLAGHRAPAVDHPRAPTRSSSSTSGRIAESGTHEELLARGGRYADLYRTQFADGEPRTESAVG